MMECNDGTPLWNTYQKDVSAPTMVSGLGVMVWYM